MEKDARLLEMEWKRREEETESYFRIDRDMTVVRMMTPTHMMIVTQAGSQCQTIIALQIMAAGGRWCCLRVVVQD